MMRQRRTDLVPFRRTREKSSQICFNLRLLTSDLCLYHPSIFLLCPFSPNPCNPPEADRSADRPPTSVFSRSDDYFYPSKSLGQMSASVCACPVAPADGTGVCLRLIQFLNSFLPCRVIYLFMDVPQVFTIPVNCGV